MRPLLELAARQDITRRSVELAMGDHFHLTEEEMALRVPSGQHGLVKDRAGWAMTYLTKACMLAKIAPKTYRATESGLAFLRDHTGNINRGDLLAIDTFREFKLRSRETRRKGSESQGAHDESDDTQTPAKSSVARLQPSIPMSVSDSWKRSSRKTPSSSSIWYWMF